MGHVGTLFGEPDSSTSPSPTNGWAGEGIAEYISRTGLPRSTYPRLRSVRTYLRAADGTAPCPSTSTPPTGSPSTPRVPLGHDWPTVAAGVAAYLR